MNSRLTRTPKKTGRKRRQAASTPKKLADDINKLKKNQDKIISKINDILVELDKSTLHKTPDGMYT